VKLDLLKPEGYRPPVPANEGALWRHPTS
jgi:hypothetical protein